MMPELHVVIYELRIVVVRIMTIIYRLNLLNGHAFGWQFVGRLISQTFLLMVHVSPGRQFSTQLHWLASWLHSCSSIV